MLHREVDGTPLSKVGGVERASNGGYYWESTFLMTLSDGAENGVIM